MPAPAVVQSSEEDTAPELNMMAQGPATFRQRGSRAAALVAVAVAALLALAVASRGSAWSRPSQTSLPGPAQAQSGVESPISLEEVASRNTANPPPPTAASARDGDAGKLILATDGNSFVFSFNVSGPAAAGSTDKDIILDTGSAFFLRVKKSGSEIEFVMAPISGANAVELSGPVSSDDESGTVYVAKSNSSLCLLSAGKQNCVDSTEQMKLPGTLTWGVDETIAKGYAQQAGSVPISLKLNGVDDSLLNKMSNQISKLMLTDAIAASIALIGGFGVSKLDVSVAYDDDGNQVTSAQSTLANLKKNAVSVQLKLQSELGKLKVEMQKRINDIPAEKLEAIAPSGTVTVTDISVPATPTECGTFDCGTYYEAAQGGVKCVGSSCDQVCCAPLSCSKFSGCPSALELGNPEGTCSSELGCLQTCCKTTCGTSLAYCPAGTCPMEDAAGKTVPLIQYDEVCCTPYTTPCCDAPVAACLACKVCMQPAEFCEKVNAQGRRLTALSATNTSAVDRILRGQSGSGQGGGLELRAWWKQFYSRRQRITAVRLEDRKNAEAASVSRSVARAEIKIQAALLAQTMQNRTESMIELFKSTTDESKKQFKDDFQIWKDEFLKTVGANSSQSLGCVADPTSTCSYKLRSHFVPTGQVMDVQPVSCVNVMWGGIRAVTGNKGSGNLYMFTLSNGEPHIPYGRFADGTAKDAGILVAGGEDAGYVTSCALALDGQHGAVGYSTGQLKFYNAGDIYYPPKSKDLALPESMIGAINSMASMPSYKMLLLGLETNWTIMYQARSGGIIRFPRNISTLDETIGRRQEIIKQAFNDRFATGNSPPTEEEVNKFYEDINNFIQANLPNIQPANEATIASFSNVNDYGAVKAVVYVPISTKFATAHADGKVRYWTSISGRQLFQMKGHVGSVNALAAHPAKEIVASGGDDGTVRVWDFTGSGKLLYLFDQKVGGAVYSLAIIPGGQFLVAGSADGVLRKYDLRSGEPVCHTQTFAGAITAISPDPSDVTQIAIGTESGQTMVYRGR